MEDDQIVALYWERSETAIEETTQKYGKSLFLLSMNIVFNHESAEECVNDTYLKAWNAMPPQKPVFLFAFLAKITRRLAFGRLDYANAQKRKANIIEIGEELESCIATPSDTESQYEIEFILETINTFLKSLTPEKRNVFVRRYWFTDSIIELEKRFSISESKVKSMLFRTRNELREYLQKEGIQL